MIQLTPQSYLSLCEAYTEARDNGLEEFTWEGNEFVTDYAMFLIQWVETRFNLKPYTRGNKA